MVTDAELEEVSDCILESEPHEQDECRKMGVRAGMDFLAEGSNRIVFSDEGSVYKFNRIESDSWPNGNEREVKLFHDADPELQEHLATPLDWGEDYSWVEYPEYPEEGFRERKRAQQLLDKHGWECWDMHSGNVIGPEGEDEFIISDYESCIPEDNREAYEPSHYHPFSEYYVSTD